MPNYLLCISNDEPVTAHTIHDPATKLKIKVFNRPDLKFEPCMGEMRFFATDAGEIIAFETMGYKKHRELLILHMISWYCVYLGLAEAKIHTSWPVYTDAAKVV